MRLAFAFRFHLFNGFDPVDDEHDLLRLHSHLSVLILLLASGGLLHVGLSFVAQH